MCVFLCILADISSYSGSQEELTKAITPIRKETKKFTLSDILPHPCDPGRWLHRYFMLALMCFLSFGSYYVYDNPTALQDSIESVSCILTHYELFFLHGIIDAIRGW